MCVVGALCRPRLRSQLRSFSIVVDIFALAKLSLKSLLGIVDGAWSSQLLYYASLPKPEANASGFVESGFMPLRLYITPIGNSASRSEPVLCQSPKPH